MRGVLFAKHKKKRLPVLDSRLSAETKGFEPLIQFPVYTLSRRAPSTTRTSLHSNAKGLAESAEYAERTNLFCDFSEK